MIRYTEHSDDRPALLREIASLRARVAELEALLAVNAANTVNAAANTPANSRNAYMRDYMRRRRALENKNSSSV